MAEKKVKKKAPVKKKMGRPPKANIIDKNFLFVG